MDNFMLKCLLVLLKLMPIKGIDLSQIKIITSTLSKSLTFFVLRIKWLKMYVELIIKIIQDFSYSF